MPMRFAFISRHVPTAEQEFLAEARGVELVHIGDRDAFTVTPAEVAEAGDFDGVVVVHPAAAMRLCIAYNVGVFENAIRTVEGGKPAFSAKSLCIYRKKGK